MPHIVIIIEAKKNTVFIPFSWSSWAFLPSKTWTESNNKMLKTFLMNKPYNTMQYDGNRSLSIYEQNTPYSQMADTREKTGA